MGITKQGLYNIEMKFEKIFKNLKINPVISRTAKLEVVLQMHKKLVRITKKKNLRLPVVVCKKITFSNSLRVS